MATLVEQLMSEISKKKNELAALEKALDALQGGKVAKKKSGAGGGASLVVADTAPSSGTEGDLWFNSNDGGVYVYYDSYWVLSSGEAGPQGIQGPTGPAGETLPAGGTTGQVLAKATDGDQDVEWVTINTDIMVIMGAY